MGKLNFSAGMASSSVVAGGERMKEMEANKAYNFKTIPREKIIPNPMNKKYSQEDIDELKNSILDNGLLHNLVVVYDIDKNNYRLVSGERRFRAINAMNQMEYNKVFPSGIPAKVEKSNITEVDEEILLITANSEIRDKSMEEKRWEVLRLKELYEIKKSKGEITNIGKTIAEKLNISERQAIKYMNTENLIPELSAMLDANGIKIDEASAFGTLTVDSQKQILDLLQKNGRVDKSEIQTIKQSEKEKKELQAQLNKTEAELSQKNQIVEDLERQVAFLQKKAQTSTKKDIKSQLEKLKAEKAKAEKDKQRLSDSLEEMKLRQKEKESRNINASDDELKRIADITKAEQLIASCEGNLKALKRDVVISDDALKSKLAALADIIKQLVEE